MKWSFDNVRQTFQARIKPPRLHMLHFVRDFPACPRGRSAVCVCLSKGILIFCSLKAVRIEFH